MKTTTAQIARNGQDIIIRAYARVGEQIAYSLGEKLSQGGKWISCHWRPRTGEIVKIDFHDGKAITGQWPSGGYWWTTTLTIKQAYIRRIW